MNKTKLQAAAHGTCGFVNGVLNSYNIDGSKTLDFSRLRKVQGLFIPASSEPSGQETIWGGKNKPGHAPQLAAGYLTRKR